MATAHIESPRPSDNGEVRLSEDAILIADRIWYSPSIGTAWASRLCERKSGSYYKRLCILSDKSNHGYHTLRNKGVELRIHRLAWEAFHGAIPKGMVIDHINGITDDNRLLNLRAVTIKVNTNKRKPSKRNSSGATGVDKRYGRYRAQIYINGRHEFLGSFASKCEAYAAYLARKTDVHGLLSVSHLPPVESIKEQPEHIP